MGRLMIGNLGWRYQEGFTTVASPLVALLHPRYTLIPFRQEVNLVKDSTLDR